MTVSMIFLFRQVGIFLSLRISVINSVNSCTLDVWSLKICFTKSERNKARRKRLPLGYITIKWLVSWCTDQIVVWRGDDYISCCYFTIAFSSIATLEAPFLGPLLQKMVRVIVFTSVPINSLLYTSNICCAMFAQMPMVQLVFVTVEIVVAAWSAGVSCQALYCPNATVSTGTSILPSCCLKAITAVLQHSRQLTLFERPLRYLS